MIKGVFTNVVLLFFCCIICGACGNNEAKNNQVRDSLLALNSSDSTILQYAQGIEKIKNSYKIEESPIYSKNDISFYVQLYKNADLPVVYKEFNNLGKNGFLNKSYYLENGDLVLYEETSKSFEDYNNAGYVYKQSRVYFRNKVFLKAEERVAKSQKQLENLLFTTVDKGLIDQSDTFDVEKLNNALDGLGEFDLSFKSINKHVKSKYLILNRDGGFSSSYKIITPDSLIYKIENDSSYYIGKKMKIDYVRVGEDMIYKTGSLADSDSK